jgi:hypothetical protein
MQSKKLSQAQKKIITAGLIVLCLFLGFWFFVYLPGRITVKKIKSELLDTENQIQEIEGMIQESRNRDEGIKLLKERYEQLNNKFPQEEEDALKALSEIARELKIGLVSIKAQPKTAFLDADNKEVNIEGKSCQRVFVYIEMRGSYKDLVKYILSLEESNSALTTIEELKVSKDESGAAKLNITLGLNLYLLS